MIKQERINDLEFDIYKVEEIKKAFNAKDIADIINKFPNYSIRLWITKYYSEFVLYC